MGILVKLFNPFNSKEEITGKEIEEKLSELKKETKDGVIDLTPKMDIVIMDRKYRLIKEKEIFNFLKLDLLDLKFYSADYNDCDDYAIRLFGRIKEKAKGLAFGFIISDSHAYNMFINENKEVKFLEPQSDKIYTLKQIKSKRNYYPIKLILM